MDFCIALDINSLTDQILLGCSNNGILRQTIRLSVFWLGLYYVYQHSSAGCQAYPIVVGSTNQMLCLRNAQLLNPTTSALDLLLEMKHNWSEATTS